MARGTLRRTLTGVLAASMVTAGLTACGHSGDWDQMCVDPSTQLRMPDYYCHPGAYYHPSWVYYVPYGYRAPAYNQRVTHYTINNYHRPSHVHIHTDPIPSTGGKVTKPATPSRPGSRSGTSGGSWNKPKSRGGSTYKAPARSGRK